MLNWNKVLMYIKGRMGLPSGFIENSDQEIKDWIILTTLPEFSGYIPDIEWAVVDPTDAKHKTEKQNHYLFFDKEQLPVYGIANYYWSGTGVFATGHPYTSPTTFDGIKEWALSAMKSQMLRPFSYWGFTGKFIRPNIIRVLPTISEQFVVEYEREQPPDLHKIPAEHSRLFMDLALADIQIWIGQKRSMYGDGRIQTPFGEIPLNGSMFKEEGKELKRETIEKLSMLAMPSIIIDTNN